MADLVERLRRSEIQHGPVNDRIYLMKLAPEDLPGILDDLDALEGKGGYGKIFAKVPSRFQGAFEERGYVREAAVSGFFGPGKDAAFMCRYGDPDRRRDRMAEKVREVLFLAAQAGERAGRSVERNALPVQEAGPELAEELAEIYAEIFPTYPFPIQDPEHLVEMMGSNVRYYCVRDDRGVAAVSAAEMDPDLGTVEMTDFATVPDRRGQGLAVRLLAHMDREMRALGIRTTYTIARALSPGMNMVFARQGYIFGGTLTNNTNIGGRIESMNVWYKPLTTAGGSAP